MKIEDMIAADTMIGLLSGGRICQKTRMELQPSIIALSSTSTGRDKKYERIRNTEKRVSETHINHNQPSCVL